MAKLTKLNTTMGIELTFMPPCLQEMVEAINPECDREVDDVVHPFACNHICSGYALVLGKVMQARNIPTWDGVKTDPGCVEVPTKPYGTLNGLVKASRQIWKCASSIGLVPKLDSFNGGGAHIHTGIMGKTPEQRVEYVGRMALFAAQNPWLSWAFVGLVDDINAEPIAMRHIVCVEPTTREQLQDMIAERKASLATHELLLHGKDGCFSGAMGYSKRLRCQAKIDSSRAHLMRAKLALHRFRDSELAVTDLRMPRHGKDNVMRWADYGPNGTIEFRAFEMPEDIATLTRYIKLADAIVGYVAQQSWTHVALPEIPTNEQQKAMTWRQRRDGFNAMLVKLGLNPADYKAERVQIALRMRFYRPKPVAPLIASMDAAIAGTRAALRGEDNYELAA
ncbi:MAG TPA: hypothetical protein VN679_15315 [Candidatus Acidoferrales bacterium]|nr:hypothetical protein [Candidatus Acidoferrales bacterium]